MSEKTIEELKTIIGGLDWAIDQSTDEIWARDSIILKAKLSEVLEQSKGNPNAERPNEDCGCNMLRISSNQRCTCKDKANDCQTFVNYVCSTCGCECKLRCNICTTCFPHVDHEPISSHCYDCGMNEAAQREVEENYYEDW